MPASNSQIGAAVAPGSMAYGDRAGFNSSLAGSGGGGQPAPAGGAPGMQPSPGDPLGMLLGGGLGAGDGEPVTSGLSVGPGPGATAAPGVPDDVAARLRLVALNAKTPMLRSMARQALRRRVMSNGVW